MNIDEIRDYIRKIAEAAGIESNAEWAAKAGVDPDMLERFMDGGDIGLNDFLELSKAVEAFVLPIPSEKKDEAVILLEESGIYAEGVTDPFAKYRNI